jgi:uncharacterized protein (TIGR02598 family)
MKWSQPSSAFSLVETVIAMGIFAFCIVVLMGLFPVGMRATRSVANEANSIHIASSVMAAWKIAPLNGQVTVTNVFSNLSIAPGGPTTNYFNDEGNLVSSPTEAALAMGYHVTPVANFPNTFQVDLNFRWPVNASTNIQQSRSFSQVFSK